MKNKSLLLIVSILIIATFVPKTIYADIGPKPSVVVDFEGLEGESYYVTLLSEIPSTGPHSALEIYEHNQRVNEGDAEYEIWKKFVDYKDINEFYFLQYYQDCTEASQFRWGYYPPPKFKILIYFSEKDRFIVSQKIYERYAFDSYFTATIDEFDLAVSNSSDAFITVEKSYDYLKEIISLFARIIATIIIEVLIALLFRLRKKNFLMYIVTVNIITQSILNILLNLTNYYHGGMMFVFNFIWMEVRVFIIEAVAYSRWLKKAGSQANIKKWVPVVYALCANAISFGVGLYIAYLMPVGEGQYISHLISNIF